MGLTVGRIQYKPTVPGETVAIKTAYSNFRKGITYIAGYWVLSWPEVFVSRCSAEGSDTVVSVVARKSRGRRGKYFPLICQYMENKPSNNRVSGALSHSIP